MSRKTLLMMCLIALWQTSPASAVTKYPGLNYVEPLSIERGQTTILTINTNGDVTTAYKALIQGEGITAKVLERKKKQPKGVVEIEVAVPAEATVGPREIRVATKEAITTAGRFYVTDSKTVSEAPKNDELAQAQVLQLPVTVNGRVERTLDMDWYKFDASKGERVTFAVRGVRLHDTIHKIGRFINHFDAMLTLYDANGTELALNDDHYNADPLLSYSIPEDGTYYLCLREATYKGNAFYTYSLVATNRPWPTHALPLAIPNKETATVTLYGHGYQQPMQAKAAPLSHVSTAFYPLVKPQGLNQPQPELRLATTDLPLVAESEKQAKENEAGQPLSLPVGVFGLIGTQGDVDTFSFEATKGKTYEFEVLARRLYTRLDSELTLYNSKGKRLTSNDDGRDFLNRQSKDSLIRWKAPADGTYKLELRDMMGQGGPQFAYHLSLKEVEPDFEITCNPDLAMIGPESRTPLFVKVHRFNGFDQPVRLTVEGLPEGVTATEATIPKGQNESVIILSATKDAQIDATNFTLTGHSTLLQEGKESTVKKRAIPLAEIYQAGYRIPVHTQAIAVTEPSDIRLETPVRKIALKPGESKEIPIKLHRTEKYKGGRVSLVIDHGKYGRTLPKEISIDTRRSQLVLSGDKTEGKVTLTASKSAKPVENLPMTVIGQVSVEFSVFVPYCTDLIEVSVLAGD